jgi:NAD(P)-dependent dehydrogenase (short-subunit alcohol dehydrogenase family)
MELQGSVAIVTGGASGLGEATTRRFVDAGASVVIVDMNAEKGAALADELGEAVQFAQADVANPEQVQAAVDAATATGPLRVAVNCAGTGWVGRLVNRDGSPHDLDVFKKILEINLIGTFNVCRLAASAMAVQEPNDGGERGVLINTASVAAFDGQIGQDAYSASKAGVAGMTLPLARDCAPIGIRVVTIAPGLFDTPLLGLLPPDQKDALSLNVVFPKRLGDVAEYAMLTEQIVRNPYLNGETIRLDGALRMPPKG